MVNRGKRWSAAVVGLVATVVLASCALNEGNGEPGASGGGATTLRIGTTTDVANFNPLQSLSKTDNWILNAMYPHLLRIDGNARKVPELAQKYEYQDGGNKAVFTLRDDFVWSDGKPVTSADVKYSAEMIMKHELGNVAAKLGLVESIDTPDDTTVTFDLERPYAPFAEGVGFWMAIVPKHVFEKAGDVSKFANDSEWVGAGAYILQSATPGQRYVMKRNDQYPYAPKGGAAVETVEYRVYPDVNTMQLALRNGDIDLMGTPVPASAVASFSGDQKIKLQEVGSLGFAHITYNVNNKHLAKQEVRQALSMVVDTQSIIKTVLQGEAEPMVGPISPIFDEYDNTGLKPYPFDPAGARKLLEEAGYADENGDGKLDGLNLEMVCDQSNPNLTRVAQVVREDAAKAGVELTASCVERNTFLSRTKSGDYDIDVSQWAVFDNPMDQLRSTYLSSNPGGINYNLVKDDKLDDLIDAAAGTTEHEQLVTRVKEIDAYVHDQALLTPLYVEKIRFAYDGSKFTGFQPSPSDLLGMVTGFSLSQVKPVT
ncbi:ABC transporter substrate-binding protein [Nonomuraea sp. KC401]|nr:ABC transporter substrate-binding protein [Nonomuraea sp. K271]TLF68493.1 ABC transporter substrate-binding protein [Nonomuraea sp. KC401]